ncbi:MAG: lmo0937 family membrane protein [Spirochaetales bacterium]|nr:lmo0937 family membrane protein [Spirochaetales bacterium]
MGRIVDVLLVIGIILLVLWLLGFATTYTFNGYIHVALVIAIICVGIWVINRLIGSRR